MPFPTDPIRAEVARKKMCESSRSRWDKNSEREKASKSQKIRFSNPTERKRMSEITSKAKQSEEYRAKMSETMKIYFSEHSQHSLGKPMSDATKKKVSDAKKRYYAENPEARQLISIQTKERFKDPKHRRILSEAQKLINTPERREQNSKTIRDLYLKRPDIVKRQQAARTKRYLDKSWYGCVVHYDSPQYCEKFNTAFKERVRAYFGYKCFECGIPQNGKKHAVHHVHYDKKMCCNGSPQDVVPLCNSCHTKTNTSRDYWEDHFTELLYSNDPEGKCFFTKEEMKMFTRGNMKCQR